MTTQVDLAFTKNQNWLCAFNMSLWALLYDLTQGVYRMHVRTAAGAVPIVYGFSSSTADNLGGTIVYDPLTTLLFTLAPYADMRYVPAGTYAYDLQYLPGLSVASGVPIVQDLASGTLVVTSGVTRS